jgi:hypothetical protein
MPPDTTESGPSGPTDTDSAKTEPLACVSCRARKLKCDRTKPACTRCVKVSNDCVYPESRRKPTFKRRNVKELEARLGTNYISFLAIYNTQVANYIHQPKSRIISKRLIRIHQRESQMMTVLFTKLTPRLTSSMLTSHPRSLRQ